MIQLGILARGHFCGGPEPLYPKLAKGFALDIPVGRSDRGDLQRCSWSKLPGI